jgi:hypothetical protein
VDRSLYVPGSPAIGALTRFAGTAEEPAGDGVEPIPAILNRVVRAQSYLYLSTMGTDKKYCGIQVPAC